MNRSRVSQIINAPEGKVSGRLFERTSRRVTLTPIGEQLLETVAGPYRELRDAFLAPRQSASGISGPLRIGMYLPINGGRYMAEITRTFKATHPACDVELVDTGLDRDDLESVRPGDVALLATRLTVGPILSSEQRLLLVSSDPLAARKSVWVDDFADRPVPDTPPFRREMIDVFIPPVSPSGRRLPRVPTRSAEDLLLGVAVGEQVHPPVASLLAYFNYPEITSVPISDLPPSQTALVWLTANVAPQIHAFACTAERVLSAHDRPENRDVVSHGQFGASA